MKPSGAAKLDFCNRLGPDWKALADYLDVPIADRDRFDRGDETRETWEWLERRERLEELPEALKVIKRADLLIRFPQPTTSSPISDPTELPWTDPPYPGLQHFTEREAPIFFGREPEVKELLARLPQDRLIAVVGASGSGKSSLVGAGLIPQLQKIPGHGEWVHRRCTPGEVARHPFESLVNACRYDLGDHLRSSQALVDKLVKRPDPAMLTELLPNRRVLLFIDQFEELFTTVPPVWHDPTDPTRQLDLRHLFLRFIHRAAETERLYTVLTVRADFFHHCVADQDLAARLRRGSYPLAAPGAVARLAMIEGPARKVGLPLELGLTERILQDTGDEPGALALMAYALAQLYQRDRDSGSLTLDSYQKLGGVAQAIGEHAERVFRDLDEEAQARFDQVFRELVQVDDNGVATRQRVRLARVSVGPAEGRLVEALSQEARLLTLSRDGLGEEPLVEVAHEALFEGWERLQRWKEAHKDDLRLLRQLRLAVTEWKRERKVEAFRWPEERLRPTREMVKRLRLRLMAEEQEFLRPEVDRLLEEINNPATDHFQRVEIGDRLARIGDPRPGVGVRQDGVPDIVWCDVPEVVTSIDGTKAFRDKLFQIAKYPVTCRQYQAFLEAEDGYRDRQWWAGVAGQRLKPNQQSRTFGNHPAVRVSWYDAVAFCCWLSHRLGYKVRLPTEWEWRQAATGGDPANEYPWGVERDEARANTSESGLSRTMTVGMYPAGSSPVGALDMAGNVWEWCQCDFQKSGRKSIRGESWNGALDNRKMFAGHATPSSRDAYTGFRIAR